SVRNRPLQPQAVAGRRIGEAQGQILGGVPAQDAGGVDGAGFGDESGAGEEAAAAGNSGEGGEDDQEEDDMGDPLRSPDPLLDAAILGELEAVGAHGRYVGLLDAHGG